MSTYRAAYIPDDGSSTSGGLVLTTYEERNLTDQQLIKSAMTAAEYAGFQVDQADLAIGDWTE